MKTIIILVGIAAAVVIVGISIASPSINSFDDFVYQLKEPFDGAESERIGMITDNIRTIPAPREFLRMNCEDLYMYQEPPSQDVEDAWSTRLHECQNDQEKLPVLIELERWRQISCLDIINNTVPEFENVVSQQAFDIRWNQCMEIMESEIDESKNEN